MVVMTISELLTWDEIKALLVLYESHKLDGQFVELCRKQLIEPNLDRFNRLTGQENDAEFLAYLLEATLNAVEAGRRKNVA